MKKIGLTLKIFLSTVECKKIINSFEDNKSPGIDGLVNLSIHVFG
jgi:hypothetical protein